MSSTTDRGDDRAGFQPDYTVPPGATLEEWLDEHGMTQVDLANRIDMSAKALNQIINGHVPLTQETALKLEAVTGVPARLWNSLEAVYAEDKARLKRVEKLATEVPFLARVPVAYLRKRGLITAHRTDKVGILAQVFDFFAVADTHSWERVWQSPQAAFHRSQAFDSAPGAVATWLRLGELAAAEQHGRLPYDKRKLERSLLELRALTREPDPGVFVPRLNEIAGAAGLAVVFVPEVPGARCSGAARWISGRPLIQLSLRYKSDDHLWFTLFHEIGHILLHRSSGSFLEDGPADGGDELETQANTFASDHLIPPAHTAELARLRTLVDITAFADRIGVSPGIVVGRLQHDGRLNYRTGNGLKHRYTFAPQ